MVAAISPALGSTWMDYGALRVAIDLMITNINATFANILTLLGNTDWLTSIINSNELQPIIDAVKASAITLCVLFFLIDFFNKSLNLQWVTWENVIMFAIKVFVAKIFIDKSPEICEMIYSGFSSMVSSAISAAGNMSSTPGNTFYFIQPGDYEALWLTEKEAKRLTDPLYQLPKLLDFSPLLISIKSSLMGLIIDFLLIICEVIVIGRIFELVVYSIIAPLPLATFASDGLQEVGKGFLKSFVAVSLQAMVLAVMFISYIFITKAFNNLNYINDDGAIVKFFGSFDGLVRILALTMGVMQSGSWAKRICNAM